MDERAGRIKMKKQLMIVCIIVILLTVELSGCNENSNTINLEKNKFVGTWQNTTMINPMILFSDGTGSMISTNVTWDLKDGDLVIKPLLDLSVTWMYNYLFTNNDRTLSLTSAKTNGSTVVWIKQ